MTLLRRRFVCWLQPSSLLLGGRHHQRPEAKPRRRKFCINEGNTAVVVFFGERDDVVVFFGERDDKDGILDAQADKHLRMDNVRRMRARHDSTWRGRGGEPYRRLCFHPATLVRIRSGTHIVLGSILSALWWEYSKSSCGTLTFA